MDAVASASAIIPAMVCSISEAATFSPPTFSMSLSRSENRIERVILTVPGVREVAVVAKPHAMLDEAPVAFVIAEESLGEAPALPDAIMAACQGALANFKHPHEVRVVKDMPRSTLEKVAKAELRKLLKQA